MISVILIEPKNSGNIGAISRNMANFDVKNLVLVNPKVNHLSQISRNRAKHSQQILEKAKVVDWSYLKKFDYLIATTAKVGRDYNLVRSPISPRQLKELINTKSKIGLVIGRESSGLTNEEIKQCDFVVSIPASKKYPTMNISHSVAVLLYELFDSESSIDHIAPIGSAEKKQLLKLLDVVLKKGAYSNDEKRETQRKVWKRLIGRSFMSKREAYALMGFFKKVL
jgi:tRNA/rRNA methyltransferase